MPTTSGMKGGGFYDAHSREQRASLNVVLPWLEAAVPELPEPAAESAAWRFLDIGSSEGSNAMHAMGRLIQAVRCDSDRPIEVIFDDLPTNDFNQLFRNLSDPAQTAISSPRVFHAAIAGSAFERLMPPASLHVATTFNAIGFLERCPDAMLPNYILPMGPGPNAPREGVFVTPAEQTPFAAQAEADLMSFYRARAGELVPGGKLLVQVFGRNEQHSTSDGIYDVLSDAVLDQVESGALPHDLYRDLVFPIWFRTVDELLAPVRTDAGLGRSFRIERQESYEVPAPFNLRFSETGESAVWARDYAGFLRAFTESILARAIPRQLNRPAVIERIYRGVEARLLADPSRYEFHYVSVAALLTRT